MVANYPVDLALEQLLPQELDVLARPDRRIHFCEYSRGRPDIQKQMPYGHLAPEVEMRKHLLHLQRRLERFPGRKVQQVDRRQGALVGEIRRDEHRQPLGMRRPRGVVGGQALKVLLRLDDLRIGGHDFRRLAVQGQADLRRLVRKALSGRLHAAHDELEVRVVVALFRPDHQELALAVRAPVQAVRAVEHEDLERGDAVFFHQI